MTELETLEAEVTTLKDAYDARKAVARALLDATETRMTAARQFLAENESRLPYRLAAAAVGDAEWNAERVAAFQAELAEARATIAEGELLAKGLTELIKKDWLAYARLIKAIARRDQFKRRAGLPVA